MIVPASQKAHGRAKNKVLSVILGQSRQYCMTRDRPQPNKLATNNKGKGNRMKQRIKTSAFRLGTQATKGLRDFTHI